MNYEYRLFMVQEAKEWKFMHLASEPLRDGAVVEVERPGSDLDGLSVIVYSMLKPARWKARDRLRPRVASIGSAAVGRRFSG